MKFTSTLLALFLTFTAPFSFAETASEANIKKMLETRMGSEMKIDSISKTPYSGLFEVRVGNDIFYADEKAQYVLFGQLVDTKTRQNLTRARVEEINKIKFSDLPLEYALKTVKGNGKRVMAIFEDPNCGYCKRFRHSLSALDNVTIYTFMYNILSEDSAVKSRNAWCAPDRNKAWDDWMLSGKVPPTAAENCTAPNDKVLEFGRKINVNGTPAVFFADGSRISGVVDIKTLEAKLNSVK